MQGRFLISIAGLTLVISACTPSPNTGVAEPVSTTTTEAAVVTTSEVTLPPAEDTETGFVESVTDGDSLQVNINGEVIEVRLIGINAPEGDACYGSEARADLAALVAGQQVLLAAGEEELDDNDRLLRYLLLDGSEEPVLVNGELVAAGSAVALQNGHEHEVAFKNLEDRAYASGKGMWATFVCAPPDGGVAPDRPQLRIGELAYDPPGEDNNDLGNEWIEIVNESYTTVAMDNWTIRDESASNRYTIPTGTSLNPGGTLRVITGCGSDGDGARYWCSDSAVWSNGGDTVILQDPLGNVVARWVYAADG
jgi:endonuclease YncB( thermonuclease family)